MPQSLPAALHSALRSLWRSCRRFKLWAREWIPFILWLTFQCLRHRKKAVILCRCGAMGDVVCTLPLCAEIRRLHPQRLFVFVTAADYKNLVMLANAADLVYGSKTWVWPFCLPAHFNVLGLVAAVYNPQTTDERSKTSGATCHLVDDLAASCGLVVTVRQPHLYPPPDLVKRARMAFNLTPEVVGNRLIIGINGGRTWPVRMWDASKWQSLLDKIHSEYDAVIIQFGITRHDGSDEFDNLRGAQSLTNRLKPEEIVALAAICDLVIAIDSGPVHLAGAVGTPVVGLFGPVNPDFRLPPDSRSVGLCGDVDCLFCHHRTPLGHWHTGCPNNIRCMDQLQVGSVFDATKSMLAGNKIQPDTKPFVSNPNHL